MKKEDANETVGRRCANECASCGEEDGSEVRFTDRWGLQFLCSGCAESHDDEVNDRADGEIPKP